MTEATYTQHLIGCTFRHLGQGTVFTLGSYNRINDCVTVTWEAKSVTYRLTDVVVFIYGTAKTTPTWIMCKKLSNGKVGSVPPPWIPGITYYGLINPLTKKPEAYSNPIETGTLQNSVPVGRSVTKEHLICLMRMVPVDSDSIDYEFLYKKWLTQL